MQAQQSSMGLNSAITEETSGKFAALRHITRQMELQQMELHRVTHATGGTGAIRVATHAANVASGTPAPAPESRIPPATAVAEGAGLAHDAGNLLGALSLYSDLLAMPGVLHEEHREYAAELRMLSDRSWAMIDRLVDHSNRKRTAVPAQTVVLPDVIDRCRGLMSRVAGRTVHISYGIGAFHPVAVAEESVERILTNLVKNASEATPWVGAISIHVEGTVESGATGPARVSMAVRDRGCGMDPAAVRRIMQNGGISSANERGIGFRVVRELVALSGGGLHVESQPDLGTTVTMEWQALSGSPMYPAIHDEIGSTRLTSQQRV